MLRFINAKVTTDWMNEEIDDLVVGYVVRFPISEQSKVYPVVKDLSGTYQQITIPDPEIPTFKQMTLAFDLAIAGYCLKGECTGRVVISNSGDVVGTLYDVGSIVEEFDFEKAYKYGDEILYKKGDNEVVIVGYNHFDYWKGDIIDIASALASEGEEAGVGFMHEFGSESFRATFLCAYTNREIFKHYSEVEYSNPLELMLKKHKRMC